MSRSLTVYRLDLAKLAAAAGSGSQALLRRVLRANADDIAEHDAYWQSELAKKLPRYLSLADAIAQVIHGDIAPRARPRFQFEHAVCRIARTLGKELDADELSETHDAFWWDVDALIEIRRRQAGLAPRGWPTLHQLIERGPYLTVPLDREYRLGSGFLTADEVRETLAAIAKLDLGEEAGGAELEWPEEAMSVTELYRTWIRKAARSGVGLFVHC